VSRRGTLLGDDRRGGQVQGRLGHVVARIGLDQRAELLALGLAGTRADHHAVAAGLVSRLDHQLVQVGQHVLEVFFVVAQEAGHVGQDRLFAQVVPDHLRHIGKHHLVIGHPRAGRIGQRHLAGAPATDQAGHAQQRIGMEHFRIEKQIVHPPIDHIHPLRAVDGAHVGAVVIGHEQVRAFDQLDAHGLGQVGMFEIGTVEHARGQQGDHRRIARTRRQRGQGVVELAGIFVHRQDRAGLEQFREHALGHHAVFQHVADPGGNAQVVLQRVQGAVGVAHQVRAADVRPHAQRRGDAHALWAEIDRILEQHRREHLVLDDLLLAVDVADEQVQRAHALLEPGLGDFPFLARDHPWDQVERQRAVDVAAVRVHGEGDAHDAGDDIGSQLAFCDLKTGQAAQIFHQATGGGARLAVGLDQLIKGGTSVLLPVHSLRSVDPCTGGKRCKRGDVRQHARKP